jgi:hypothetical protein
MSRLLTALGRDWMRAPIAQTSGIVLFVAGAVSLYMGDIDRALLLWIFSELQFMQTAPRQMERHPGCVAPHCLRGGICTGPCKVDQP